MACVPAAACYKKNGTGDIEILFKGCGKWACNVYATVLYTERCRCLCSCKSQNQLWPDKSVPVTGIAAVLQRKYKVAALSCPFRMLRSKQRGTKLNPGTSRHSLKDEIRVVRGRYTAMLGTSVLAPSCCRDACDRCPHAISTLSFTLLQMHGPCHRLLQRQLAVRQCCTQALCHGSIAKSSEQRLFRQNTHAILLGDNPEHCCYWYNAHACRHTPGHPWKRVGGIEAGLPVPCGPPPRRGQENCIHLVNGMLEDVPQHPRHLVGDTVRFAVALRHFQLPLVDIACNHLNEPGETEGGTTQACDADTSHACCTAAGTPTPVF